MTARTTLLRFAGASRRRRPSRCATLSPAPASAEEPARILPPVPRFSPRELRLYGASSTSSLRSEHEFRIPGISRRSHFYSTHAISDVAEGGMVDVPLAQTGEGIAECELLKWFVQEGDQVDEFQPLCEVQSDKATIEITSRYKGSVAQTLYIPGDIVKVGETLLRMIVPGFHASELPVENLDSSSIDSEQKSSGKVLSTPAVRDLAKQYSVDISDIAGTGNDGRVLKDDILKYAVEKEIIEDSLTESDPIVQFKSCPYASRRAGQNYEDVTVPLRGFQRKMTVSMSLAAKVPHFHYVEDIYCDALVKLKQSFQNHNSDPNVKFTFLPVLIKSLSVAMTKFPSMNSCYKEESLEVILKGSHNIGVAMATQYGLVVPNIKSVQSLSIFEITKEISRLQELASDNKLSPEDISGGTITLSNIGAIGGRFGAPLLNLPEVSIIALGRIQKVPRFAEDGTIYPASIMTVNIGADHRVLDGATVARFCSHWKNLIENPHLLMLHLQ